MLHLLLFFVDSESDDKILVAVRGYAAFQHQQLQGENHRQKFST